jgi:hypothetical protein
VLYEDPTLEHLVTSARRIYKNGRVEEETSSDPIPEELVEQLEPFIGDGESRIIVSGTLSSTVDYQKAEAFVSVSVPCGTSLDHIRKAHDIVRAFVNDLLIEDLETMKGLRDSSKKGSLPPKGPSSKTAIQDQETPAKVINRPSFRR